MSEDATSTNPNKLPQGFNDLTPQVRARFYQHAPAERTETHKACLDATLNSVVKFNDGYLTCFGDNAPVAGNSLGAAVDAVQLNTKSLKRGEIKKLLPKVTYVQRHAYYPGFPRFLSVNGAVTFNTWKPAQRLLITENDFKKWVKANKPIDNSLDGLDGQDFAFVFSYETMPLIWATLMKMLFGNAYSEVKSESWFEEQWDFTRWAACVVYKPMTRPLWAPVLRSVHGVGKGTFEAVMRALMGSAAVNTVANLEGLTGEHNGDAALTRLLVLNEVLQKGRDTKADQRLKMFVSDPVIEVNRKHEQRFFTLATHATILYSNSRTPFVVPKTERRFWVPAYREYDVGEDHGQAFHAEGNRLIREDLTKPDVIHDLLCWLKLIADTTPATFLSVAPPSDGIQEMYDIVSEDKHDDLKTWLEGLGTMDALQLAQVQREANVVQGELIDLLKRLGFRNCQMRSHGNRKGWTKAPVGQSPKNLRQYNPE